MTTKLVGKDYIRETLSTIKSCLSCVHLPICSPFRAFAQYLDQTFKDQPCPLKSEDLALICTAYLNTEVVKMLSGVST